ncbi:MAG: hypothetical protein WA209_13105 [Candidatus Acidiferrales bacterium]
MMARRYFLEDLTIYSLDADSATPQPVAGMPKIANSTQWTAARDGIYFVPFERPRSVEFYDFATKRIRRLFRTEKNLQEGMSVSPDGRYLLYSQVDQYNADITLATHFR